MNNELENYLVEINVKITHLHRKKVLHDGHHEMIIYGKEELVRQLKQARDCLRSCQEESDLTVIASEFDYLSEGAKI